MPCEPFDWWMQNALFSDKPTSGTYGNTAFLWWPYESLWVMRVDCWAVGGDVCKRMEEFFPVVWRACVWWWAIGWIFMGLIGGFPISKLSRTKSTPMLGFAKSIFCGVKRIILQNWSWLNYCFDVLFANSQFFLVKPPFLFVKLILAGSVGQTRHFDGPSNPWKDQIPGEGHLRQLWAFQMRTELWACRSRGEHYLKPRWD